MIIQTLKNSLILLALLGLYAISSAAKAEQYIYRPLVGECGIPLSQRDRISSGTTAASIKYGVTGAAQIFCKMLGPTTNSSNILVNKVSVAVVDPDGPGYNYSVGVQIRSAADNNTYPFKTFFDSNQGASGRKWISSTNAFAVNPQIETLYAVMTLYRKPGFTGSVHVLSIKVEYEDFR